MVSSGSSGGKHASAQEHCAGCRSGPLESSLCMACEHRLCLSCAAQQIRVGASGSHAAQCPLCGKDTQVNADAATYLLGLRGSSGGNTGTGARTAADAALPAKAPSATDQPMAVPSTSSRVPESRSTPAAWQASWEPSHSETAGPCVGRDTVADSVKLSEAERACGQCQAALAEIECWECGERFCSRCSAFIHKRGRLKEHTLMPFTEKRSPRTPPRSPRGAAVAAGELHDRSMATPSVPSSGRFLNSSQMGTSSQTIAALPAGLEFGQSTEEAGEGSSQRATSPFFGGRVVCCPVHPEDPLQFFCLTCENQECICAECAVHGAHRGHDVLNVRHAHKQLSGDIANAIEASHVRQEAHAREMQRASAGRSEVDLVIAKGKRSIQDMFEKMRASLSQKEAELLQAADQVERLAAEAFARRTAAAEGHVRTLQEAQTVLRRMDNRGDEVKVLNIYAGARGKVMSVLTPLEGLDGDAERDLEDLKAKVQQALDFQVSEVATLGTHVSDIRSSRPIGSREPSTPPTSFP